MLIGEIVKKIASVIDTSTLMTFKTDNAGVSSSTQVKLPLQSNGTYNFIVNWGDGTQSTITTYNQAETTHSYSIAGTYDVKITGTCYGWSYNNGGDKLKLLEIKRWGTGFRLGNNSYYFFGCANLKITATDILNLTDTFKFEYLFRGCASLISVPNITNWNTSNITNMAHMFENATPFNQDLRNLNVSKVTDMTAMFYNVSLSSTNYDALLNGWSLLTLRTGVPFNAGSSKYSPAGVSARAILTGTYGWIITDGGLA